MSLALTGGKGAGKREEGIFRLRPVPEEWNRFNFVASCGEESIHRLVALLINPSSQQKQTERGAKKLALYDTMCDPVPRKAIAEIVR